MVEDNIIMYTHDKAKSLCLSAYPECFRIARQLRHFFGTAVSLTPSTVELADTLLCSHAASALTDVFLTCKKIAADGRLC